MSRETGRKSKDQSAGDRTTDQNPAFVPWCLCGEIVRLWSLPCTIPNPVNHKGTETQRTTHGGEARWGSASFVPWCLCGESSGLAAGALGLGEKHAFIQQRFADQGRIGAVYLEDIDSGPTHRRQPDQLGLVPDEVLNPSGRCVDETGGPPGRWRGQCRKGSAPCVCCSADTTTRDWRTPSARRAVAGRCDPPGTAVQRTAPGTDNTRSKNEHAAALES